MNVSLNAHFEEFVAEQLANGRYNNASEIVRAGLRLLEEKELKLTELKSEIEKGYVGDPIAFDADNIKKLGRTRKRSINNMPKVELSIEARNDLVSVWVYLAENGDDAIADRFIDQLQQACVKLAQMPTMENLKTISVKGLGDTFLKSTLSTMTL